MENSERRDGHLPLAEVVSDCVRRWFQDMMKEVRAGDSAMQVLVGQMYQSGYGLAWNEQKVDLEEAKGQEIAKLQSVVQEMHEQLEEAKDAIIKEKEAARIAIEQAPPVIMEVPVVDNTKLELLTNHNKELEDELSEFKIKAEEFEKRYYEVQNKTEDLIKETEESQSKICQLQEMMERLETNLSSLESENQVLRQQALEASKNEDLSEEIKSPESKIAELESENQLLRARPAVVIQQLVTVEAIQAPVVETQYQRHPGRRLLLPRPLALREPPALKRSSAL